MPDDAAFAVASPIEESFGARAWPFAFVADCPNERMRIRDRQRGVGFAHGSLERGQFLLRGGGCVESDLRYRILGLGDNPATADQLETVSRHAAAGAVDCSFR